MSEMAIPGGGVVRHPARYTGALLPVLDELLPRGGRILDPFAGTGRLREIRPGAVLVEIEPEWAAIGGAVVGDALSLPFRAGAFDAVCTSPVYGNRMSDKFRDHQVDKGYRRNTYTHALGRDLHPRNAGRLQWGEGYREFHRRAWREVWRVLADGGGFVLNVKDHIRGGEVQRVSAWHLETCEDIGFMFGWEYRVPVRGNRMGANGSARVDYESVYVFRKSEKNARLIGGGRRGTKHPPVRSSEPGGRPGGAPEHPGAGRL